ncbi:MAG: hypothetical protein IJI10_08415 [Eubacterium sp.]|nr:hypothetical protein [Eubacterium sp.]
MNCSIPRHRDRPDLPAAALQDLRGGQHRTPEAERQRAGLPLRALHPEQPGGHLSRREEQDLPREIPVRAGAGGQAVRL